MSRFRVIPIGLGFWILAGFLWAGVPAEARQNDRELLDSGKNCSTNLFANAKKQSHRIYWKKCIEPFEQLIEWYPESPLVDRSLFILGGLYRGLYGYSGATHDRDRSVSYYRRLLADYPDSSLARRTRSRLKALGYASVPAKSPSRPSAVIERVRYWDYPEYTRLVLDLNRSFEFRQSEETDPDTLRLTLVNTKLSPQARSQLASMNDGVLKWVEVKPVDGTAVELSVAEKESIQNQKVIRLDHPDRLVIDLFKADNASLSLKTAPPAVNAPTPPPAVAIRRIVVDPGHGGKDPGAIGRHGLMEKDVVLDIGLRLRKLIESRLGKSVIMTRDSDEFIELSGRTDLANSKKADLFVSIHANSHPKRSTRGVEIYYLGQSSDRHALSVAARENSVSLESADNLDRSVKNILLDLGLEYKIDQSLAVADTTSRSFRNVLSKRFRYKVHDLRVKQAPFYVLMNAKMPGILAEVGYISNSTEEKLLRKRQYRQALAETLFEGVKQYVTALESDS
jgi:N-acetylmuramoyl-L-alanine amidase